MSQQDTISPTLFDLLAREWTTGAGVRSVQFNASQTAVAFALDDGTVAIAAIDDEDPPQSRIHVSAEDGRSTIRPRSKAPAPLNVVEVERNAGLLLSSIGETDFLVCGETTDLHTLTPEGALKPMDVDVPGPVTSVDSCAATGRFACVGGTRISVFAEDTSTPDLSLDHGEPVTAISFAPDGQSMAVAHDHGLTIWTLNAGRQNINDVAFTGRPDAIHWSPDGMWIATPLSEGGFQLTSPHDSQTGPLTDYPAPVSSVAWNRQANALVTSGAFRVAAWSMNTPPLDDPSSGALETGRAGLVPVSAVSSHTDRDLVVAGYRNGFIAIVQVGGRDELMLNSEDRGAVTNLIWSHDGNHVAVATDRERAAIITLPPQMFK